MQVINLFNQRTFTQLIMNPGFASNIFKFISFRSSNRKPNHKRKINLDNKNIEQAKSTTFLGIIIDKCLTWKDHIAQVAKNHKSLRINSKN